MLFPDMHWNPDNIVYGNNPQDTLGLGIYTPDMSVIIQSRNIYIYCMNNPLEYIDPTGELAWPGEIHNQVVSQVAFKYGFHFEQIISYNFGWGRADLLRGLGEVRDVKRNKPRRIGNGVAQV